MNTDLQSLQAYPFEKLNALTADVCGNSELMPIALSIGEPQHLPPDFVLSALNDNLNRFNRYPTTKGLPQLRDAISQWASRRFQLRAGSLTADNHVLPVCGTREALFSFTQAVIDRSNMPLVVSPNPFYQIYEGGSLLAGASPIFSIALKIIAMMVILVLFPSSFGNSVNYCFYALRAIPRAVLSAVRLINT